MDYAESLNKNASAFSKNSLSFLCALRDETIKNRRYTEEIKRKQKNKLASERGITLLSLIITVVIMIILAAVTISVTLGDGGLVDQAKWAAEQTANSTQSEQEQLDDVASQVNEIIAGIGGGTGGGVTNTTPGEDTNQIEETNTVETNTIDPEPEPPEPLPDGTISIGEPQWQPGGTANVTVSTTEEGVTIEYQIGGTEEGSWTPVTGGTITGIENGQTVYVRITNGEQSSNPQEITVRDETKPTVNVQLQGTTTTNSISVSVSAEDNETGMADSLTYTYYIKESSQGDESYTSPEGATGIANNTYTFTGLEQSKSYDIKVEVNGDKAGNVGTGFLAGQSTGTIPGGDEGVEQGRITFGPANWADGKASVTISTDTGLQLQYQKNTTNDDGWEETENNGEVTGLSHGDTVYARLTDGNNYGDYASTNILDNEVPAQATIQPNTTNILIGESLTATVTHTDTKSGVDINASGWVLNTTASAIGTDNTSAYTGKFTTNGETITLDSSNAGTYYLHVLTTDVAGNKTETVSSAITISAITGTVTQNGQVTWSAGQATLVLQTTESQYTIVYKINGEGSWQTYNGTSITGLSHGDKVTACLTNASQTTYGPEATFEIKDETDPTVTVTAQGSPSTNSITVTAQAVDNESGMKAEPTYTFQIKQSSQGSYTTPSGAENISNATYTFTGLTQGTSYDIQVIVNGDNAGNSGTGTLLNQTTQTVPGADEGLETGTITASPVAWSGGKASTTLTTTTSFQIQYQVGGISEESWSSPANSPVTVSNLDHGSIVYARLTDGTNAGNYAAINILDGTPPTVSVEVGEVTYNSIEVTVTAEDKESGLADSNAYRYYLNDEPTPRATSNSNTYTYEGLTGSTDYTIKVEVVDKAGTPGTGTAQATTLKAPATNVNELEAGDFVYYEDAKGTRQLCAVLYDSSSEYGVEIITMNTVENVRLGSDSILNTAINDYNNAIATLNNATSKYINTIYADASRSVGSVPSNPSQESADYFTSSYSYMSSYNGRFKDGDNNYETDYNQMEMLGIRGSNNYYWLASRYVVSDINRTDFYVRNASSGGEFTSFSLCYVYGSAGSMETIGLTCGLRPVFHLRDTVQVTGGTGTKEDPYILYAETPISDTETQVANYADVDGNGTVDGVIYADLAIGGSGSGLGQSYTIPKGSNFKKYEVTQESYSGSFGTGQVIAPVSGSSGNERFYVMALENAASGTYQFWGSGGTSVVTSTDFGTGESNTAAMKAKSGSSSYLWGISEVQSGTWNGSSGWYVPSRGEWSAFADQLDITTSNYSSKGLSNYYGSSSQYSARNAWDANFYYGSSDYGDVTNSHYVRLGTTF